MLGSTLLGNYHMGACMADYVGPPLFMMRHNGLMLLMTESKVYLDYASNPKFNSGII